MVDLWAASLTGVLWYMRGWDSCIKISFLSQLSPMQGNFSSPARKMRTFWRVHAISDGNVFYIFVYCCGSLQYDSSIWHQKASLTEAALDFFPISEFMPSALCCLTCSNLVHLLFFWAVTWCLLLLLLYCIVLSIYVNFRRVESFPSSFDNGVIPLLFYFSQNIVLKHGKNLGKAGSIPLSKNEATCSSSK